MVGNITTTEISNKEQRFTKERSAVQALDNSTQQSSQLLTSTDASKPYFYIYVGPGKTGTTTVQDTFSKLDKEGILEKDNYVYLGRFSRHNEKWSTLAFCMLDPKYRARYNNTMSKDDCWQKSALPAAQEILSRNHLPNLIIHDEWIEHGKGFHVAAFRKAFWQYNIKIVVGYRRTWSWEISQKNQKEKVDMSLWPTRNAARGRPKPAIPFFIQKARAKASRSEHLADHYSRLFGGNDKVRIFDMHHQDKNLAAHLACDILSHAPHICTAAKNTTMPTSNPSRDVSWDYIAVSLGDRGLVDKSKWIDRQSAVEALETCATERNLSLHPVCLSDSLSKLYLENSLHMEKRLVDKYSNKSPWLQQLTTLESREEHQESFWKSTPKMCSPNITSIVEDKDWKDCLALLC